MKFILTFSLFLLTSITLHAKDFTVLLPNGQVLCGQARTSIKTLDDIQKVNKELNIECIIKGNAMQCSDGTIVIDDNCKEII